MLHKYVTQPSLRRLFTDLKRIVDPVLELHDELGKAIEERGTENFGAIFLEFQERFLIYGQFVIECTKVKEALHRETAEEREHLNQHLEAAQVKMSAKGEDVKVPKINTLDELTAMPFAHVLRSVCRCYTSGHCFFSGLQVLSFFRSGIISC